MSIEVARFLDNTEYSTNAMINFPRKLYRHPSLRVSCHIETSAVYDDWPYLVTKVQKVNCKTKDFVLFLLRWVSERRNWFSPYERYERRKRNFLYRKLFTPYLNVFLYTKVIYLSVISFIAHRSGTRKCAIYAS